MKAVLMTSIGLASIALMLVRWLFVAQREHYLPGGVARTLKLWIIKSPSARLWMASMVVGSVGAAVIQSWFGVAFAVLVAASAFAFPLSLVSATRSLRWTRRLIRLLGLTLILLTTVAVGVWLLDLGTSTVPLVLVVLMPFVVEIAVWAIVPLEDRLAGRFQRAAMRRLAEVSPMVVAVTGSYGKTSTKGHIVDLAVGSVRTVASPASYNNRAGLSRTVNDYLRDDTELLVAEMGMYGPGEIRDLCSWLRPTIGVITAIGPMHLSRAGSMERIASAKAEIVERTQHAVLWVGDAHLSRLADELDGRQRVWRCGPKVLGDFDVTTIDHGEYFDVLVNGGRIGSTVPGSGVFEANIACAVGAALAAGIAPEEVGSRLGTLRVPPHRAESHKTDTGVIVLDDTFNSNPGGARRAVDDLVRVSGGRRVVVTPGMFELGRFQEEANEEFASYVVQSNADLIVVGRTNRDALVSGASKSADSVSVRSVSSREAARRLVAAELNEGDAVLWENDLPLHYP